MPRYGKRMDCKQNDSIQKNKRRHKLSALRRNKLTRVGTELAYRRATIAPMDATIRTRTPAAGQDHAPRRTREAGWEHPGASNSSLTAACPELGGKDTDGVGQSEESRLPPYTEIPLSSTTTTLVPLAHSHLRRWPIQPTESSKRTLGHCTVNM